MLAALTAASVIWSVQPSDTWLQANLLVAYLVAFGAAIALARVTPRGSGWVVAGVLMACVAVCVWALLTKVLPGIAQPRRRLSVACASHSATGTRSA